MMGQFLVCLRSSLIFICVGNADAVVFSNEYAGSCDWFHSFILDWEVQLSYL